MMSHESNHAARGPGCQVNGVQPALPRIATVYMAVAAGALFWRMVVIASRADKANRTSLFCSTAIALSQLSGDELNFVSSLIEERNNQSKQALFRQCVSKFFSCFFRFFWFGWNYFPCAVNGLSNFGNKIKRLFLGFYVGAVSIVKTDDQAFARHLIFRMFKRHKNSSVAVDLTVATMDECGGGSNTTACKRLSGKGGRAAWWLS